MIKNIIQVEPSRPPLPDTASSGLWPVGSRLTPLPKLSSRSSSKSRHILTTRPSRPKPELSESQRKKQRQSTTRMQARKYALFFFFWHSFDIREEVENKLMCIKDYFNFHAHCLMKTLKIISTGLFFLFIIFLFPWETRR